MKVIKMKKLANSRYKLTMDNGSDIILFEEVILNNIILTGKTIDDELYKKIVNDNYKVEPYYHALKYINTRMRSRDEVKNFLLNKIDDNDIINNVLERLEKEGHIDDRAFARAYLNDKLTLSNDGVNKIKRALSNFGISDAIIVEVLDGMDKEELTDRLDKLIAKQLRLNTRYTGNMLKNKIYNYLLNLGYDSLSVLERLNEQQFKDNSDIEKEYSTIYKKYVKKYSGYKLDMTIKQKLYQKGYDQSDIEKIVK